ncbi:MULTISPECIES: FmdE family protein [Methanothermobacter]|uniref:FwdE-related protein n=1 Tax=Methanothermobacter marburgensis (strain ATCC BAA-927 / DSM 2133 / JCM 14651 / NBRC 100331 / OCM 82 / Marburg) TaxID=79929 RepID=D9PYK6_METTM|nr:MULTISPECIES: FmdE family protein [Methanothermobacter]ADL59304.1 FwdE-related protein [Methanothermobacter marburgensis str. Marburg]QEF94541.1 formylmethanofuran dehydrogenase [Methanothermobacter sp. KEPCO-1]QHN07686.1 formylmethanofuran dehydrogenase [Methanothermobacter sp. THM-2]WBF09798.1 TraR/DksA C4-type zinc finger protein [Methanothermobacter marburgensis]
MDYSDIVKFHGHSCAGTALGYKVGKIVADRFGRSEDEEIVAVVENDSCSIDSIQFMTGCTFGKGNLIFRDHGKHVYTFLNRKTGEGIRISLKKTIDELMDELGAADRAEMTDRILEMDPHELFDVTDVVEEIPEKARIYGSVRCAECGEPVSEHRARIKNGEIVCIPCFRA